MRDIQASEIQQAVCDLILRASYQIGPDVLEALRNAQSAEESPTGQLVLTQLLENHAIAAHEQVPICQDTGMMVLFTEVGQDVHMIGGSFEEAIQAGAADAWRVGYLRASIVTDPLFERINTGNNTPAVLHTRIVPGEHIHILVSPKGFGSENMSRVRLFSPSAGVEGVTSFIVETVCEAGPNPCPPVIVGVGIGGDLETCALLAKRMTTRPVGSQHPDPRYAALEEACLHQINDLGIGPAGLGGRTTALAVHIEYAPTHIAGLPVAVNLCCHAARHAEATL